MELEDRAPQQPSSVDAQVNAWLKRYPEEIRAFLSAFGEDDRECKIAEAYNHELLELAAYCHGKPRYVFKLLIEELQEEWADVILQDVPASEDGDLTLAGLFAVQSRGDDETE